MTASLKSLFMFSGKAQRKPSSIGMNEYIYWKLSLWFSKLDVLILYGFAFYLFNLMQNNSGVWNLFFCASKFLNIDRKNHLCLSSNIDTCNWRIYIPHTFRPFPSTRLGWFSDWINFLRSKNLKCSRFSWTDYISNRNRNQLYDQKVEKSSTHCLPLEMCRYSLNILCFLKNHIKWKLL